MAAPRTTPLFNTLYKQLNPAQKEAVDTIEGPVMVVAGPGTGKTQILTLRIANILKETDTPPDAILALTFTEAAAAHMRRRLARIIGSAGYRVHIHTFHGFCNDVIQRFPEEFPRIIGGEPITEVEKLTLLRDIIEHTELAHLKPFGNNFHYLNPLRQSFGELKRENITPEQLTEYIAQAQERFAAIDDLYHEKGAHAGKMRGKYQSYAKKVARTEEMAVLYSAYETALRERGQYDFEDMIMEVVMALGSNSDLLLRLQEEFHYILADEHQDANAAQNRLLELLASFHENPNLFVVGDEKQAIFRFQGASLENFNYFKEQYPNAALIHLTESYRSGQRILDVSHSLARAGVGGERAHALVTRASIANEQIQWRVFSKSAYERAWIASDIAARIGEGVEPSEIAVLYRTNSEAAALASALEGEGLGVSIESGQNVLDDPEVRTFLTLLRAVANFGNDELLAAALHLSFLPVDALDFYKIARHARREHCLFADVLASKKALTAAGVAHTKELHALYRDLARWAKGGEAVPSLIERIMRESGFLAHVLSQARHVELLEKLEGLLRDSEALAAGNGDYTLADLMRHIALLETYRVPIRKEIKSAPRPGAVRLMTVHRAKGLEFAYVYVVNLADGVWGGRRESERFALPTGGARGALPAAKEPAAAGDDDERRLLFVAITRAQLGVFLSMGIERDSGSEQLPSRFIEEIDNALVEVAETSAFEEKTPIGLAAPKKAARAKGSERAFLQELFLEQGLSVTALNHYLTCPWQYFYNSLVRIPKVPNKHMLLGTAVHQALKRYFDEHARGLPPEKARLLHHFTDACVRLPLAQKEIDEVRERGGSFLAGWFDAASGQWPRDVFTEYKILVDAPLSGSITSLRLRGDLDKLEIESGSARVVDYKTGKPKTRNAILGKTKTGTGDYWRQLVFYKLLLDIEGRHTMKEGVLDFVQPDPKSGAYRKEAFAVTAEDVAELSEVISRVADEIYTLSFWDTRCESEKCEFCALRELMHDA